MKLFYSVALVALTTTTFLFGAALPASAAPSWTITCRKAYPYSPILTAAIQQRVLDSIDATQFTNASAVVRLQLVRSAVVNTPVEVSVETALNGIELVADPHATGLAFSVQGSGDLRQAGQCVYQYVVSITTRAKNIETNLPFNTATVSSIQVFGPLEGSVKKHLSGTNP